MRDNILFFFLILFGLPAFGQQQDIDTVYADSTYYYEDEYYEEEDSNGGYSGYLGEINIVFDTPVGIMKKKFKKSFFGIGLGVYKQINENIPLLIGAGFFYKGYDSESISYYDYSQEDGLEYEFSEEFKGRVFGFDFGAKYFSDKSFWIFNPYVQMDLEYRRAYASINTVNLDLDETINTDFEGGNSSLGYKVGVGSIVKVDSDKFFLNFRVSYSSGGGLFLYKRNDETSAVYVTDYFEKKHFPIGLFTISLGLTFL